MLLLGWLMVLLLEFPLDLSSTETPDDVGSGEVRAMEDGTPQPPPNPPNP